ncbi:hypothetical protein [Pseudomonas chlororaphis]|uniref:TubC N-terminal docking domain-containing protein n=1 Tax=Pseudomonas chlororaphis TaxID=587753 RepID=A0A0D5XUJ5_9PSED|nr:hypothetical protein [Pseudomonas chlororaphis]AKA22733.1 hypothetical protein PCL1606_12780 [Pseudomonas chlororaphis]
MSAAIDYLAQHGLSARKKGNRVVVSPRAMVTEDLKKYIRAHRLELLAELAANDGLERRCGWTVVLPGRKPFTMISEPITRDEALADVRCRWPDADVE